MATKKKGNDDKGFKGVTKKANVDKEKQPESAKFNKGKSADSKGGKKVNPFVKKSADAKEDKKANPFQKNKKKK